MAFFDKNTDQEDNTMGVLAFNCDGVLVEANEKYIAMSGVLKVNILNKPLEDFDVYSAEKINAHNNSLSGHYYSRLARINNESLPVEIYYICQLSKQGMLITLFIKNIPNADTNNLHLPISNEILKQSKEAIMVTDSKGYIESVNQKFCNITGYSQGEIIGKTPTVLNSGVQGGSFYKNFWLQLKNEGCWQGEIWNKRKNGNIYPEWLNISSIKNTDGNISNYIALFTDITKRKKSQEEQHFQAYHDPLTNLPNRKLLFQKLNYLCAPNSEMQAQFVVLFCDLDRFKLINDSLSHDVGDALLKSVASRLEAALRENDIVARSGGDEFIVVIEGEKALQNIDNICRQILTLFDKPFHTPHGEFNIGISIGASRFPEDSMDVRELISFADVAMLKVKKRGGHDYTLFDAREKEMIKQRLELEQEIFQAIENMEFEVWYQPQVNVHTNEVYGVECLLRWNHPKHGLISPDLFIPIAEANGAIKSLGYFVLKTACKQLREWRISNVFTGVMAVNVSIRQFDRNDLLAQVRDVLIEEMLPGNSVEIEVTESLFSDDYAHFIPTLSAIRALGVKIAIDDFGTGFSSLQRLKTLPIDNVKIDKCFVDNLISSKEDCAIVKAVILLSKTFHFNLIAEGIESREQAEKLKRLGCNNHQGFLYSKPLRAHDFEKWINNFEVKPEHQLSLTHNMDCK